MTDNYEARLWDTNIIIVAFLITTQFDEVIDRFLVPANPFRIRIDSEYNDFIDLVEQQYELIQGEDTDGNA